MRKMNRSVALIGIIVFFQWSMNSGCNHAKDGACAEDNISEHNSDKSHNMGQNCMSCHTIGGEGEGCFKAAGTAYNESQNSTVANVTVRLYKGENGSGEIVATLFGDDLGNFYTTEDIDYSAGLFPGISRNGSDFEYMESKIYQGACNSCHGISQDVIWVE